MSTRPRDAAAAHATWFGDQPVTPDQRTRRVRDVFASVAHRYDLMNDLMSGGIHRLWKASLIRAMRPAPGRRLLDVAGGTGDVALAYVAAAGAGAEAIICDLSPEMLAVGRDRALDRALAAEISHVVGTAEQLPIADRSVDTYAIAFGLRNVTRIDRALAEARRVLRPGGRFFCLEFSQVRAPGLARAYRLYSEALIPRLGQLVAGDRASYAYLIESIRRFPGPEDLAALMAEAGLARPRWTRLSGGIAALHSGWRL